MDEVVGPHNCQLESDKPELSCIVQYKGNIPPNMEWSSLKENVSDIQLNVTQETSDINVTYHLMLKVDLSINGSTYICQTTRSTSAQHSCSLDPIKILYALDTKFVKYASINEELICSANSSQSCSYRWKWFQNDDVTTESKNASLKPTKTGWHKCEAECSINKQPCSILAMHVFVYLNSAYDLLVIKPQDTEVLLGHSTYLNCSTSIVNKDMRWYHHAVGASPLEKREVYAYGKIYKPYLGRFNIDKTFNGSFNLLINSVQEEDAGRYDCQDDGGFGDITSAQLVVLVADPVCRTTTAMDEMVGPNSCQLEPDKPKMSCIVQYRGNIPPIMEWRSLKENVSDIQPNVTQETNDFNVTYHLMLNVDLSVNGSTYICQTTRLTSAQLSCFLDPIKILYAFDTNFTANASMNEELICSANSSQSCSYRWIWFQYDDVSTESKNASLKPTKPGWHKCEANCSIKNHQCSILVMLALVYQTQTELSNSDSGRVRTILLGVLLPLSILFVSVIIGICVKKKINKRSSKIPGRDCHEKLLHASTLVGPVQHTPCCNPKQGIKLRAVWDFYPEEMTETQGNELKDILLSTISNTESEYSETSPLKPENMSDEHLNLNTNVLSFKKGDQMETIPPTDIGDAIKWWKAKHTESGKVGYIPRNLVIIDYELQGYTTSQDTWMNILPFELLDSILQKSHLERILKRKQVRENKGYDAISQLASVDCCWFQRIRKRKFKNEVWRSLVVFYIRRENLSSIYRISRQYVEENVQLRGLVNRLKSNDCLTDFEAASLFRKNLAFGNKSFGRFRCLISEVVKNNEAIHSVFRKCLCDTKQHLIGEVLENGGAVVRVEIKNHKAETSVETLHPNLKFIEIINEIRGKMIARSRQIEELMCKLKQDDLEIISACQDGDVIKVWMWCKTKLALEKLHTMNKSKNIIDVFTELIKNLSFSSEERNPAIIKPKVNIDFEQFEKTVVFFSIVANFNSRLDLKRRRADETEKEGYVTGVTKLRNKIHVLLYYSSAPRCAIDVFEDQIPFRLQKSIEIKEIEYPVDIASIEMENSLYVLDHKRCVWKIKEEGDEKEEKKKIIRWLELEDYYDKPHNLSLTRFGQLMLVSWMKNDTLLRLRIFGEGESEKADLHVSISLPEDIQNPIHAVETCKGNFIIFHAMKRKKEDENRSDGGRRQIEEKMLVVSEVSGDGKTIIRRFIPKNEEQELSFDLSSDLVGHLVVDFLYRVFLTDFGNNRVILLDSDLHWKEILIPTEEDRKEGRMVRRPRRLFYGEEKKELIVGGGGKAVFVYNLKSFCKETNRQLTNDRRQTMAKEIMDSGFSQYEQPCLPSYEISKFNRMLS